MAYTPAAEAFREALEALIHEHWDGIGPHVDLLDEADMDPLEAAELQSQQLTGWVLTIATGHLADGESSGVVRISRPYQGSHQTVGILYDALHF